MRLRYKIGLIVIAVSFAVCLMTFQSYALWIKDMVAVQENVVNIGCFEIEYKAKEGTDIKLQNTYPVNDQKGLSGTPYTFTITNKCTVDDSYIVTLNTSTKNEIKATDEENKVEVVVGKDKNNQDIVEKFDPFNMTDKVKFAISKENGVANGDTDQNKPTKGENLGEFAKKDEEKNINTDKSQLPNPNEIDKSIIIGSGTLKGKQDGEERGESVTYHLYLWLDGDAGKVGNEVMGQSFHASVHIINQATEIKPYQPFPKEVFNNVIDEGAGTGESDANGNGLYKVTHSDLTSLSEKEGGILASDLEGWKQPEYRYAGPDPSNYVTFNEELWRIIGLVNVKTSSGNIVQRLKIIKASKIADDYWDSSGVNDWTNASLMKKLNEEQGEYYQQIVTDKSKSMIAEDIIWNIGGVSDDDYNSLYANQWYDKERGTEVYEGRPSTWPKEDDLTTKAKVGLMYPSDYGYAVGGNKEKRTECLKTELYNYSGECYEYDWLTPTSDWTWTISPSSFYSYFAFFVHSRGYVGINGYVGSNLVGVAPVVYLASNVKVSSGQGSMEDPLGSEENPFTLIME